MTVYEARRYKSEGRGLDSQWGHWDSSLAYPSGCNTALGSTQSVTDVNTAGISCGGGDNGGPCIGSHNLATSTWRMSNFRELQPPGTLRDYRGLYRDLRVFTFYGAMYESQGHSFIPIFPVSALQLLPSTVAIGLQSTSPSSVPPSTDPPFQMQ
jgi:hypothetical protein